MLSRNAKAAYFACARPLMAANALAYRALRSPCIDANARVHLGPGRANYLQGWVNVDANMFTGRCDLWADFRNRLPFRSGTIAAFYSNNVIEHLPNIAGHVVDVFRCLAPGGIYRVGGPNGDAAAAKLVSGDVDWFYKWPDARRSIGGLFDSFLLCRNEHTAILTLSYLTEILEDAGFSRIISRRARDTGFTALFSDAMMKEEDEGDSAFPHTLIVEAEKR